MSSVLDDLIARGTKRPGVRHDSAGVLAASGRAAVQMPGHLGGTEVAPPRRISPPPDLAPVRGPRRSMRRAIVGAVLVVLLAGAATAVRVAAMSSEKPSGPEASAGPTTPREPPGSILATIATGAGANKVAIAPAGYAYVSNGTDGSVAVLDTNKRVLLTTTDAEAGLIGLAVDTSAQSVYVANARNGTLSVIDTGSQTVRATVELDVIALTAVFDPAAKTVYSTTHGNGDKISAFDATNNTVRASTTIDCGRGFPFGLAVDAELGIALVVCANDIATIDITTMSGTDRIPIGPRPHKFVIDTNRHVAYVANRETGSIHAIDTRDRTLTVTVKVGRDAAHLALDTASNTAYVANREDQTISMIDTTSNTVVATVDVGGEPQGIAIDPRTQHMYVTDSERGTAIVLEGRRQLWCPRAIFGVERLTGQSHRQNAQIGILRAAVSLGCCPSGQVGGLPYC